MNQITISRYTEIGKAERQNWKDLISALCLVGYEVYADEEKIVFKLGLEDEVKNV